jgi:peptidyl-prolyl cis-trans isomerase SurA
MGRLGCLPALAALLVPAEVVDRIAVTVDRIVITESDILSQMRVAALLNGEPLDLNAEAKRAAARRLVEQALIQREIEITRYPAPALKDADPVLAQIRSQFGGPEAFAARLADYGVSEDELRRNLWRQLITLRFIDYRFRPGIAISEQEIGEYYRNEFVPQFSKNGSAPPPSLDDVRDQIEEILIGRRVDEALDKWLASAAAQARIEYREEAFR